MLTVIKNGIVLNPDNMGSKNVILGGTKIIDVCDYVDISGTEIEILDANNCYVVPGMIDSHVHACGGGGEGGFSTRTPEVKFEDIVSAGITTIVGVIGTDGTTRTMSNLLAKVYALEEQGITAYAYTGSYQVPVRTITGSITDDIVLFDKIIGVGEIALSDHRSSCPTMEELRRVISEARLGGMTSGKAGTVNIHMGDEENPLKLIYDVLKNSSIPMTNILPTHMNRNSHIFNDAVQYALNGGIVDFTTSTVPKFIEEGEVKASIAVRKMLEKGVTIDNITMSSDGQGSLPMFDSNGKLNGIKIGSCMSVYESFKEMVLKEKLDISTALKTITVNPAKILKLKSKGCIKKDYDADITVISKDTLDIKYVFAKGKLVYKK